ncbi:hypothetical protein ACPPTR_12795 [Ralstonia pseudosolanacearum]
MIHAASYATRDAFGSRRQLASVTVPSTTGTYARGIERLGTRAPSMRRSRSANLAHAPARVAPGWPATQPLDGVRDSILAHGMECALTYISEAARSR